MKPLILERIGKLCGEGKRQKANRGFTRMNADLRGRFFSSFLIRDDP
jgi:hypothetical protein